MKKQYMKLLGNNLNSEEDRAALIKHLSEQMLEGKTPREVLQLPDEDLEVIYSQAYAKYQLGDWRSAQALFQYLVTIDSTCYKFILGLAACLHRQEQFEAALKLYMYASFYKTEDPVAYFHGADCSRKLGELELTEHLLQFAVVAAEDKEQFATLKERAKLMLDGLNS